MTYTHTQTPIQSHRHTGNLMRNCINTDQINERRSQCVGSNTKWNNTFHKRISTHGSINIQRKKIDDENM